MAFEKASDMPDTVELDAGDYYVVAHSNNRLPAAFENPYYYGRSDDFTLAGNAEQTVVVNCELANSMVTVVYSDNVKNNFTDYYTVVKAGTDSLVFGRAETRAGFFEPAILSVHAVLTWNNGGTPAVKVLTGTIDNAQARRHYEIRVDALPDNGSSAIQIILDESVDSTEIISLQENGDASGRHHTIRRDLSFRRSWQIPTHWRTTKENGWKCTTRFPMPSTCRTW